MKGIGLQPWWRAAGDKGWQPLDFDLDEQTFTPGMAKRAGPGPFAAAPIVQGNWDGSGVGDVLSFPRGSLVGNRTGYWYANFDPYQGSVVCWWTPEKTRDATQTNIEYLWRIRSNYYLRYEHDPARVVLTMGGAFVLDAHVTVAGDTYCVVASWDTKNTIDGENYLRLSINDVHTYGGTIPTVGVPSTVVNIGSNVSTFPVNAILEGICVTRRVLFDGLYGTDVGNGDEIALIYDGGV